MGFLVHPLTIVITIITITIIIIIIMDDQSKCKSGVLAIGKSALGEGGMAYISVHRGLARNSVARAGRKVKDINVKEFCLFYVQL